MDACRADHLSVYGYERDTAPFLRELAKKGVTYTNAFANTHSTPSSHTTILSSQYQETHKVFWDWQSKRNWVESVPEDLTLAQDILNKHGYVSLAVTDGGYMDRRYGFSRGFAEYRTGTGAEPGAKKLIELVKEYSGADRPIFAFFHTYEIHSPYSPPDRYKTLFGEFPSNFVPSSENLIALMEKAEEVSPADLDFIKAMYDGEIRFTDDVLMQLFAELADIGFTDNYICVITSDHGEEFGEHGGFLHRGNVYDELMHIPLIIVGNGVPANKIDDRMASSIDILPTILRGIGLDVNLPLAGVDLLSSPATTDQAVIFQFGNLRYGIRTKEWKLIESPNLKKAELYNMEKDSAELINVIGKFPEQEASLRNRLDSWRQQTSAPSSPPPNEKLLDRLKSLGYTGHSDQVASRRDAAPTEARSFGHIDAINDVRRPVVHARDAISVRGWAAHTTKGAPLSRVDLIVKDVVVGTALEFFDRPDVTEHYGRADFLRSGWSVNVILPELDPGVYSLRARGVVSEGDFGDLAPLDFEVVR